MKLAGFCLLGLLSSMAFISHAGVASEDLYKDYQNLLSWKFGTTGYTIPEEGLLWQQDVGVISLESGRIYLMEPTSSGKVTGLVFEGKGRFIMAIPDKIEQQSLARFSGVPVAAGVNVPITKMIIRASNLDLSAIGDHTETNYAENALAKERHEDYLYRTTDVDSRVVNGLANPAQDYFMAEMETDVYGWLMFEFDTLKNEEITLAKLQKKGDVTEEWVRLDVERDERGRPSGDYRNPFLIPHYDIKVDLKEADWGVTKGRPVEVGFKITLNIASQEDGLRAVPLNFPVFAEIRQVSNANGEPLRFIREHVGGRFSSLDNRLYDPDVLVLLDRPLAQGETDRITFDYVMKLRNYASGLSWYPASVERYPFRYSTADFTYYHPKRIMVRSIGKLVETQKVEDGSISVWKVENPTKMFGFSFGRGFREENLEFEGIPKVISFGGVRGATTGNMVKNVGIDVAKSLDFFQKMFRHKLNSDQFYATRIESGHGQAFEGFLHLSGYTYDSEHPGASELFRAHEVAHQFWGHAVAWRSYRDQWISESFAEYSAMMFIEATMPNTGYFEDILEAYTGNLTGEAKANKFARPWQARIPKFMTKRMGPMSHGYRADTSDLGLGYTIQAYQKGPMVLHMLRSLLTYATGDQNFFFNILAEFVNTYAGKDASTEDFQRLLEARTKSSWQEFFDQWIHGTDIPTYEWNYKIRPLEEFVPPEYEVKITVKQSNVPEGFRALVPLRIEFDKNTVSNSLLLVDKPEVIQTLRVPQEPKEVIFNPNYSVLAKVDKK